MFFLGGIAFSTLPDVGGAHVAPATAPSTTSSPGEAILTVSLLAVPLLFLVGFGGFDYWFYWAAGRKTRPEDHSGHGAYTWKDYFRINTDHKVIGDPVHGQLVLLPARRRPDRDADARRARRSPGSQFVDANTFNGLFSVHASLLIFLFIIPVFAGLGQLRDPADDRRARHGLPAPERAVVLAAADRRR